MIVDTHIHLVSSDREEFPIAGFSHPGYEWVENAPDVEQFLPMMEEAGVSKGILVQPHGAYGTDNSYICSAAGSESSLFPVAIIDPFDSKRIEMLLELSKKGVVGIRLFSIPTPERPWIASTDVEPLWNSARELQMVIGICVLPSEIHEIKKCADIYPDHVIVIDHCGFAPIHQSDNPATEALWSLRKSPNVVLKVTTLVIDEWISAGRELEDLFPTLAEGFGVSRLVWGSDFAQSNDRGYSELVELGKEAMGALGTSAKYPMGLNAKRVWSLVG
ncbi:MAG: amidohydrolase family protein, partial [Actinomycetota bacterium]|nr:amidohydrolase family protein [Actinomycetota bacterium]